jgi:hypothetical protein
VKAVTEVGVLLRRHQSIVLIHQLLFGGLSIIVFWIMLNCAGIWILAVRLDVPSVIDRIEQASAHGVLALNALLLLLSTSLHQALICLLKSEIERVCH